MFPQNLSETTFNYALILSGGGAEMGDLANSPLSDPPDYSDPYISSAAMGQVRLIQKV